MSKIYQKVKNKDHLTSREQLLHDLFSTSLDFKEDTNCILMSFPSKEAIKIAKEKHIRLVYDRNEMPQNDILESNIIDDIDIVVCNSALYDSCKSKRKIVFPDNDPEYFKPYLNLKKVVNIAATSKKDSSSVVRWNTSKTCNYNCKDCCQSSMHNYPLVSDEAMIAGAKLASQFKYITVIGGEPTIYDLPNIFKYIDFSNICSFRVITNGSASYDYLRSLLSIDKKIRISCSFHTYHDGQEWLDKMKKLYDEFYGQISLSILPSKENISKLLRLNFYDLPLCVGALKYVQYINGQRGIQYITKENISYALQAKDYFFEKGNLKHNSFPQMTNIFVEDGGYIGYGLDVTPMSLINNGKLFESACSAYKNGKCIQYKNCSPCLCVSCGDNLN